jgi:hypothetical protein
MSEPEKQFTLRIIRKYSNDGEGAGSVEVDPNFVAIDRITNYSDDDPELGVEFAVSEETLRKALKQNTDIQHRIEAKVSDYVFKQMEAEKNVLKYTWSQYMALVWLNAPFLKPENYNKSPNMVPGEKGLDRVYLS